MSNNLILNDQRKKEIIRNLDDEINEMRKKYILKQPNDVKPIGETKFSSNNFSYNDTFEKKSNKNEDMNKNIKNTNNNYNISKNNNKIENFHYGIKQLQPKIINHDFINNSDGENIYEYNYDNNEDYMNNRDNHHAHELENDNEYECISNNDGTNDMNLYSQGDIEINEMDMNDIYLNKEVDEIDYLGDFKKNKNIHEKDSKFRTEIQTIGDE